MRETEFRINNLIKDRLGRVCYVEAIEYDKQEGYSINAWPKKGGGQVSLPFEPIPLTEEILLKCGFESKTGRWIGKTWYIGINPRTEDYLFKLEQTDEKIEDFFFQNSFHSVKYVHQLQNLYFCLTGEELTIEL